MKHKIILICLMTVLSVALIQATPTDYDTGLAAIQPPCEAEGQMTAAVTGFSETMPTVVLYTLPDASLMTDTGTSFAKATPLAHATTHRLLPSGTNVRQCRPNATRHALASHSKVRRCANNLRYNIVTDRRRRRY